MRYERTAPSPHEGGHLDQCWQSVVINRMSSSINYISVLSDIYILIWSLTNYFPGLAWNCTIFPISVSQVAGITGVSHQHLASRKLFILLKTNSQIIANCGSPETFLLSCKTRQGCVLKTTFIAYTNVSLT
jgi:hypothetical protein